MAYTRTNWLNGLPPSLDSTNLNKIEKGIFDLHQTIVAPGQIKFPTIQTPSSDPNTLDDYEEGTFTPDTSSWTVQPTSKNGKYRKIGSVVFITFSANGGTIPSYGGIAGLPFPIVGEGISYLFKFSQAIGYVNGHFSTSYPNHISSITGDVLGAHWWTMSGFYFTN